MTIDPDSLDDHPELAAAARLERRIGAINWFYRLADPLDPIDRALARSYLDGLGFPDAEPAAVPHLEDAAQCFETHDINSPGWEAEEQMRAALLHSALERVDEADLAIALQSVPEAAADTARPAAEDACLRFAVDDDALINAMVGAAMRASYMATLVLLTGEDDTHPAALRFQLFERGRWPLDIVGSTFHIL